MSIPAELYASTAARLAVSPELLLVALVTASIMTGIAAGVLPPRGANGPDRVAPDRPAWPLLGVVFCAFGFYLLAASSYSALRHPAGTDASTRPALDTIDMAFLSVVPPFIGFCVLLTGAIVLQRNGSADLGLKLANIPAGLSKGALGMVIVVPLLFLAEQGIELVYHQLQYQHPTEHPLLHVLGQQPSRVETAMLIGGACVVAPLFEELLFRGYVQTLLRRMLRRLNTPAAPLAPATPLGPDNAASDNANTWQSWIAIGLTSALFALVHPAWSQPVIFLLALALGYAYERTRNLWVPIAIHALFNTCSTLLFLLSTSSVT